MSNKKLAVLAIIAAFMLLWAVVQSRISKRTIVSSAAQAYLIQGLDTADIDTIIVSDQGNKVTLQRSVDDFFVAEKDNYPADISRINELLTSCLEIKTSGFVTDNPSNHESLDVTEDKAANVIKFLNADANIITGIIVGKSRELGEGTYVRLASDNKVFLSDNIPWIPIEVTNYIDTQLFSINRENIDKVTVINPDGQYTLLAPADNVSSAVIENLPQDKESIGSECDIVFTVLTNLRFDDVAKDFGDLTFDKQYICTLKDTTTYTINIATGEDESYITCTAEFGDTTPVQAGTEAESEEELKKKEAKLLAWENANTFTLEHKGWIYRIPSYLADRLTKDISELTEDIQPQENTDIENQNQMEDFEIQDSAT